jgi:ubiquinone/menaquinone biosynthesis C-methylase UbiE
MAPVAPTGLLPTVLVAIMGPYPMAYGNDGRTTLDDTLAMCATDACAAVPVFIPDLITDEEKASTVDGARLRGHTSMRNTAVNLAIACRYDYLLIADNDAKFPPHMLGRLLQHDCDLIVPRLTYPAFDPVEWLCYGPSPADHALSGGLMQLTWAAHSAFMFKVEALKRIQHPVFQGFHQEGKDYNYWNEQGIVGYMDLDTPIEVLALARGHRAFYHIPFQYHQRNGEPCPGPVYEYKRTRHVTIYRCKEEGCEYEMTSIAPKEQNLQELNNPSLLIKKEMERDHWAERAKDYGNLTWPRHKGYLRAILEAGSLREDDFVLDAGTGTGAIAHAAALKAERVIGLDISPEMLHIAGEGKRYNEEFAEGDIRAIPYPRWFFSKVFARMVLHGLVEDDEMETAVRECHRVLRTDGRLIVSEGVPTTDAIAPWYTEVFKKKEARLTITVPLLAGLLVRAGFRGVTARTYTIRQSSVRNWLENGAIGQESVTNIMDCYRRMPEAVREGYRATFVEDDVLIDTKYAIVSGVKV